MYAQFDVQTLHLSCLFRRGGVVALVEIEDLWETSAILDSARKRLDSCLLMSDFVTT